MSAARAESRRQQHSNHKASKISCDSDGGFGGGGGGDMAEAAGWGTLPGGALERILLRLGRDDVARVCAVCRRWNRVVSSDQFQRSYRKHHGRQPMARTWLASVATLDHRKDREVVAEGGGGGGGGGGARPSSSHGGEEAAAAPSPRWILLDEDKDGQAEEEKRRPSFQLAAWNLCFRERFKLLELPPCPASRSHPELCWLEFGSASSTPSSEGLLAWACRHTPSAIRVADPLHPSSVTVVPGLPPFPEAIVYEFRLGICREGNVAPRNPPSPPPQQQQQSFQRRRQLPSSPTLQSQQQQQPSSPTSQQGAAAAAGFKLAVLRLGYPHEDSASAPATCQACIYHSATGRWSWFRVSLQGDFKRWGASVVSRGYLYVLLRAPGQHGPSVRIISLNLSVTSGDPFGDHDIVLPGVTYTWHDVMDLVDRNGTLLLVIFSFANSALSIFQAEDAAPNRSTVRAQSRWMPVSSMPAGVCSQFCKDLETQWSYRCRGTSDYIFFVNTRDGSGYFFSIARKSWHSMPVADVGDTRYLFALSA